MRKVKSSLACGTTEHGGRILSFQYEGIFYEILDELGEMPLPPYIKETARRSRSLSNGICEGNGSAAAPTAGLHFTEELLEKLKQKGVQLRLLHFMLDLEHLDQSVWMTIEEHRNAFRILPNV